MTDAVSWLRAELAADREQLAAMSPTDYARAAVDTLLAPGLVVRSTVHACVYAINHAKPGADTTISLFKRPLRADCWRRRDDVQASILSALLLGVVATRYVSVPSAPALAALVTMQAVPLAVDPAAALAEVER